MAESMPSADTRRRPSPLAVKILAVLAVLTALYLGRLFVVPVLIGVLVSYALSPLVDGLARWRIPRTLASLFVILSLLGILGTMAYRLSYQTAEAARNLPEMTRRLREVVREISGQQPSVVKELQQAADAVTDVAGAGDAPGRRRPGQPMPVQVVEPTIDVQQYVWLGWQNLLLFGSQALLVVFLTFFMLSSGDLYRRKLVRLAGARLSDRRVTVEILDEVGVQISWFLVQQVMTSVAVGIATWLAFWWLGVDYPALWGVAAGVLNTVPYFGPTVVAIAAFVASFLQFDSLREAGLVSMASLAITTIEGMLVTPLLVSRLARMNPVAVFVGLLFWGWLWGAVGMLLAVPLLMVIRSVSDRVEDLRTVSELLGE